MHNRVVISRNTRPVCMGVRITVNAAKYNSFPCITSLFVVKCVNYFLDTHTVNPVYPFTVRSRISDRESSQGAVPRQGKPAQ